MTNAEEVNVSGALESAPGSVWDTLAACLASAALGNADIALPPYRRIWFQSLIRQGREAESQGRAALAAHCRTRLEQEFAAFGIEFSRPRHGDTSGDLTRTASPSEPGSSPTERKLSSASKPGHPDAPAGIALSMPPSPLKALASRRDIAARARLRELLERHAARLSSDEVAGYRQALEGASEAGMGTISDLRRRLVDRLMRAARYRRHAARLASWKPAPTEGVAGPYNDYRTLEDMMHRIASANPHAAQWAAEFFDIYADMRDVRVAYGTVLPGSK